MFSKIKVSIISSILSLVCLGFIFLNLYVVVFEPNGMIEEQNNNSSNLKSLQLFISFLPSIIPYFVFWLLSMIFIAIIKMKYKLFIVISSILFPYFYFLIAFIFWKQLFYSIDIEINENLNNISKKSLCVFIGLIALIISIIINSVFEIKQFQELESYASMNAISGILAIASTVVVLCLYAMIACDAILINDPKYKKFKIFSFILGLNSVLWIKNIKDKVIVNI